MKLIIIIDTVYNDEPLCCYCHCFAYYNSLEVLLFHSAGKNA